MIIRFFDLMFKIIEKIENMIADFNKKRQERIYRESLEEKFGVMLKLQVLVDTNEWATIGFIKSEKEPQKTEKIKDLLRRRGQDYNLSIWRLSYAVNLDGEDK